MTDTLGGIGKYKIQIYMSYNILNWAGLHEKINKIKKRKQKNQIA